MVTLIPNCSNVEHKGFMSLVLNTLNTTQRLCCFYCECCCILRVCVCACNIYTHTHTHTLFNTFSYIVTHVCWRLSECSFPFILVNTCVEVANDAYTLSVAMFCSLKMNIQRILWTFCSCFNASEAGWSPPAASANYDSDIVSLCECERAYVCNYVVASEDPWSASDSSTSHVHRSSRS